MIVLRILGECAIEVGGTRLGPDSQVLFAMKLAIAALPLLLSACATAVSHPTRSQEQMRVDIARCTDEAERRHPLDAVAALYTAYDCLEAMGYQRQQSGLQRLVEGDASERARRQPVTGRPCQVPCR